MAPKFKYTDSKPPKKYKCSDCNAQGIKLWREYQTFTPKLYCLSCAIKRSGPERKIDINTFRPDGQHELLEYSWGKGQFGDSIGWYVPAVPDEEGMGFWGYTSVPQTGCVWWALLPNGPVAEMV